VERDKSSSVYLKSPPSLKDTSTLSADRDGNSVFPGSGVGDIGSLPFLLHPNKTAMNKRQQITLEQFI
jgi:hypothetical protein